MLTANPPRRVLITGGHEQGGLASFAEALRTGFSQLGIPASVIGPREILSRWSDLRDPSVLKILSTTAVLAAPFARRAICMAHGFPRPDAQGWTKALVILASFRLANACNECRLVTVSHYAAVHLRAAFGLHVDAVIHNPLHPIFCEPWFSSEPRNAITYVGRLIPVKNLHHILPAIAQLLEQRPDLRACIIGDGPQRNELERLAAGAPRIEFLGPRQPAEIRALLRKTRVFVSGCETEALGVSYMEALSQGCAVAMPACGGGLEIAPELIGSRIQIFPLTWRVDGIRDTIRRAVASAGDRLPLDAYTPLTAAMAFLRIHQLASSWNPGAESAIARREAESDAH